MNGDMIIIVVVLALIAILLCAFRYVFKEEEPVIDTSASEIRIQNKVVIDNKDDEMMNLELVAVITAAIAASLNTTADKLIVRSLRKSQNWNREAKNNSIQ